MSRAKCVKQEVMSIYGVQYYFTDADLDVDVECRRCAGSVVDVVAAVLHEAPDIDAADAFVYVDAGLRGSRYVYLQRSDAAMDTAARRCRRRPTAREVQPPRSCPQVEVLEIGREDDGATLAGSGLYPQVLDRDRTQVDVSRSRPRLQVDGRRDIVRTVQV